MLLGQLGEGLQQGRLADPARAIDVEKGEGRLVGGEGLLEQRELGGAADELAPPE
jgi:hypothetical protein